MTTTAETQRKATAITRARRGRAKAAGMCSTCCIRRPPNAGKICDTCRMRVRVKESRAAVPDHFNPCCQMHHRHRVGCVAA